MTPQGFAKTPSATPHRVRSRSQPFGEEGLWSYGEDVGECAYECGGGVGECKHGSVCRVRMVEVMCVGGGTLCWYTDATLMSLRLALSSTSMSE